MSRLEKLQQLAATQPDDPLTHYAIGLELLTLDRAAEARDAFNRVLSLDGRYTPAFMQRARAELRLGLRDAAAETLADGIAAAQAAGDRHAADEMRKMREALA